MGRRRPIKKCIDCGKSIWVPNRRCRPCYEKNRNIFYAKNRLSSFMDKIEKTKTCWIWKAASTGFGYGSFRNKMAHRESYELFIGEIPKNLWVLHRCDNPPCVNPKHLFLGTLQDNITDMVRKGRSNHGGKHNGNSAFWRRIRALKSTAAQGRDAK